MAQTRDSMHAMADHSHGMELGLEERNKTYARFINMIKFVGGAVIIIVALLFLFTR
jgi:hypothetical protein